MVCIMRVLIFGGNIHHFLNMSLVYAHFISISANKKKITFLNFVINLVYSKKIKEKSSCFLNV